MMPTGFRMHVCTTVWGHTVGPRPAGLAARRTQACTCRPRRGHVRAYRGCRGRQLAGHRAAAAGHHESVPGPLSRWPQRPIRLIRYDAVARSPGNPTRCSRSAATCDPTATPPRRHRRARPHADSTACAPTSTALPLDLHHRRHRHRRPLLPRMTATFREPGDADDPSRPAGCHPAGLLTRCCQQGGNHPAITGHQWQRPPVGKI